MFKQNDVELTPPKLIYTKRESASIVQPPINKHLETRQLMDDASQFTTDSPSSPTSSLSVSIQNSIPKQKNAMTAHAKETTISIQHRVPVKAIRIERDYSLGDGITRFHTDFPVELAGKITPEQFQHTITEINKHMDYADRLSWRIVLENIVETLSIYLWPIFFSTHYQRAVKKLLAFIESENVTVYYPQILSISDPVRSAFLFIEINFYE